MIKLDTRNLNIELDKKVFTKSIIKIENKKRSIEFSKRIKMTKLNFYNIKHINKQKLNIINISKNN